MTGKPDYYDYLNSLRESITDLYKQETAVQGSRLMQFAVHLETVVANVEKDLSTAR